MKVRTIIATIGNYSHVVVDRETFDKVNGFRPELPYTTTRDAQGRGVRVFDIDGTKLYARKDKAEGKTVFVMNSKDAMAHLQTLAQERENEPSLEFAI
jgi:hypothetical protein